MRVTPAMCAENTRTSFGRIPQMCCGSCGAPSLGSLLRATLRRRGSYAEVRLGVALTPGIESLEHGREILSFCRKEIFIARRMARVETGRDHAMRLQSLEPGRQRIGGDACQPFLELLEAQWPLALQIAQDQQRPALADHVEGPRHRADLAIVCSHAANVRHSFQIRKLL